MRTKKPNCHALDKKENAPNTYTAGELERDIDAKKTQRGDQTTFCYNLPNFMEGINNFKPILVPDKKCRGRYFTVLK